MWRHVPRQCNPADLPSRGCTLKILLDSRWRKEPQWLRLPAKDWPNSEIQINKEVSKDKIKGVTSVNISSSETVWYLTRFSKYSRILRLVAWILRFGYNSRYHNSKRGELTVNEIQIAEKRLLKLVQQLSFDDTVTQNKLKSLNVFTDNEGLMRLKRDENSEKER
ncbi:uncharacterized protein LOC103516835 [Trichonephila inaurata madagascariensis]|uniref:Uncharacterized protein LOC103516835 n=1 Tax=Trichonephila inaurata madagascariensis TaxID=2747483 RepID=A0A8X6X9U6_9ARAC|nr:uncharacterized protein LOC103516835 [Trichonephila inaurata madagascariensis]